MIRGKATVLFTLILLATLGCRKDATHDCQEMCISYPHESNSVVGYQYIYEDPIIPSFAGFNPNNPDEILFAEIANIYAQDLIVYNWKTKAKTVLHTGIFLDNRQWGSSGWILFNTLDGPSGNYPIYKVRPDGTQKELLVASNAFSPVVHPSGAKFLYRQGSTTFVIKDMDGTTIKVCSLGGLGSAYPIAWVNDSIVTFHRVNQVWTFNTNTCESEVRVTSPFGENYFYSLGYLPPDYAVWGHADHGIYKTSITTKETTQIKASCNGKQYSRMSYSPQLDMMLLYREVITTPDTTKLYIKSRLVFMKPDGTGEKVIEIY